MSLLGQVAGVERRTVTRRLSVMFRCCRNTFKAARHALEFKQLPSMHVKGKEHPVQVFMPTGVMINPRKDQLEDVSRTASVLSYVPRALVLGARVARRGHACSLLLHICIRKWFAKKGMPAHNRHSSSRQSERAGYGCTSRVQIGQP